MGTHRARAALDDDSISENGEIIRRPTPALDVRVLRETLRLSQPKFAARFGLNLSTLRQWELGRRTPDGAARVLLAVISRSPDAVDSALQWLMAP